jgi:hypothetical protein
MVNGHTDDAEWAKSIIENYAKGQPVSLLCYEALKTEGEWCHRTMLAEYINQNQKDLFGEVSEWIKEEEKTEVSNQINMF